MVSTRCASIIEAPRPGPGRAGTQPGSRWDLQGWETGAVSGRARSTSTRRATTTSSNSGYRARRLPLIRELGGSRAAYLAKDVVRSVYEITDPELASEFVDQLGVDLQDESRPPDVRSLGRTIVRRRDQIVRGTKPSLACARFAGRPHPFRPARGSASSNRSRQPAAPCVPVAPTPHPSDSRGVVTSTGTRASPAVKIQPSMTLMTPAIIWVNRRVRKTHEVSRSPERGPGAA